MIITFLVFLLSHGLVLNQCDLTTPCADNKCCSQHGWCGVTIDYCGIGCQSNCNTTTTPPVNVNECGGSKECTDNKCCSQFGYCGVTTEYCGTGCQSNCLMAKTNTRTATKTTTTTTTKPLQTSYPITKNNLCGPEALTRCSLTGNICCSDYGVCGKTVKECGIVRYSCRPEFGKCGGKAPSKSVFPVLTNNKANVITDCVKPGMFALTYDDGVFDYTNELLNILKINNVKATFFINSYNWGDITVEPYKTYLRIAYNNGHHIASHTYDHLDLTKLSILELYNQMYRNDYTIKSVINVAPIYMRPPYGLLNDEVLVALGSWGYKVIWKNIDSDDVFHTGSGNSVELNTESYKSVLKNANYNNNSFVSLQHDTLQETVISWTQSAINLVKSLNYTFVTVGECNGEPETSKWYI